MEDYNDLKAVHRQRSYRRCLAILPRDQGHQWTKVNKRYLGEAEITIIFNKLVGRFVDSTFPTSG